MTALILAGILVSLHFNGEPIECIATGEIKYTPASRAIQIKDCGDLIFDDGFEGQE